MELNLAGDVKDNKKGFFKYVHSKRKIRENESLLLSEVGALVLKDTEKAKLLNVFSSVFKPLHSYLLESSSTEKDLGQEVNYEPAMCPSGQEGQWLH